MSKPYKPPMSLVAYVAVFALIVGGAFGFIAIYAEPVSGNYEGFARDLPNGASGSIKLRLEEADGALTGELILPPVMQKGGGGGRLTGRLEGERLFFVTVDGDGHQMTWTARADVGVLTGSYWWGTPSESALSGLDALGLWEAHIRK